MIFAVTCVSNDTIYCGKIIKSFNTIGTLLSSVILFKEPLLVNVTVEQDCMLGEIDCVEDINLIGNARPGSMVLLADEKGVERYYQQPLAKQFYTNLPEYDDVDIKVRFPIRSNYWFQGDPLPTYNSTQNLDFLQLALREIVRALGFHSSWGTWFKDQTIIVPRPLCDDGNGECSIKGRKVHKKWIGFREYIFDKYLMNLYTGEMLTDKTKDLNKFFETKNIKGRIRNLEKEFKTSTQYNIAKEMYELSTTNSTIGFFSWNDIDYKDILVLLTNISPFNDDVNLKFVDDILYYNTSDFLMRYRLPFGEILQNEIINGGNYDNSTNSTDSILYGSIGPKLMRVFETIGYATIDKPIADYKPTIPPPLPPFTESNSLGNSLYSLSSITFYQICLLLITVVYEIYLLKL
ncbi:unnamed protein product [Rhizophagus irregularis]|nr:unnamed protein product [Rhizophagus irregularis]CAB5367642.1 unnamed protein product [Rhizophagus irregularis]